MKWLALVLLAVNVIHYGWQLDQDMRLARGNRAQSLVLPAGVAGLRLVRELEAPPPVRAADDGATEFDVSAQAINDPGLAPDTGVAAEIQAGTGALPEGLVGQLPDLALPETAVAPGEYSCFSFGPLPEDRHAVWLADWFRARMIPVATRASDDGGGNLLWVYLAPQPTREEAMGVAAALERQGVRDFRVIGRGDLANAVSLGLFSSQQAVNSRLRELREKGFQPVVVPYTGVQRVQWVDVRLLRTDPVLEEMFTGFPGRYGSVPTSCEQIALDQPAP